jgi:hypothetical protein
MGRGDAQARSGRVALPRTKVVPAIAELAREVVAARRAVRAVAVDLIKVDDMVAMMQRADESRAESGVDVLCRRWRKLGCNRTASSSQRELGRRHCSVTFPSLDSSVPHQDQLSRALHGNIKSQSDPNCATHRRRRTVVFVGFPFISATTDEKCLRDDPPPHVLCSDEASDASDVGSNR